MADGTRSPYLGPHVVGQRIVVRRLVPGETGPTGGPAFTDVLGVCVAWDPCVVRTDRGTVTIPLAEIVSGKPVPPRPSQRLRAGFGECEAHGSEPWVEAFDAALDRVHVEVGSDTSRAYADAGWRVVEEVGFHLAGVAKLRRGWPHGLDDLGLAGTAYVSRDWVEVRPGETPLSELVEYAAEQGATTLWLHHHADEIPGFLLHHRCRELVSD
ncbi:hypothetical protein [Nocardioides cavernaquae]|uniref:putative acetyltransferase n=1 Tax=Nocardioides cavernaquae TaxID=2321396 RepID=UPI0011C36858|nr:hypothetical protein [Nocardioides cavernaquae]